MVLGAKFPSLRGFKYRQRKGETNMNALSQRKAVAELLAFRVTYPNRSVKADIASADRILNRYCPLGKSIGAKRDARVKQQEAIMEESTQMESALIMAGLLPE
jgi:hypothetical protein